MVDFPNWWLIRLFHSLRSDLRYLRYFDTYGIECQHYGTLISFCSVMFTYDAGRYWSCKASGVDQTLVRGVSEELKCLRDLIVKLRTLKSSSKLRELTHIGEVLQKGSCWTWKNAVIKLLFHIEPALTKIEDWRSRCVSTFTLQTSCFTACSTFIGKFCKYSA